MHDPHQPAGRDIGEHKPPALPKECGTVRGLAHERGFDSFCKHPALDWLEGNWFKAVLRGILATLLPQFRGSEWKSIHPTCALEQCRPARKPHWECRLRRALRHRKSNAPRQEFSGQDSE